MNKLTDEKVKALNELAEKTGISPKEIWETFCVIQGISPDPDPSPLIELIKKLRKA